MSARLDGPTFGFVYVATGRKFMEEALRAVHALRIHNPGVPICLLADQPPPQGIFDETVLIQNPVFGFGDKLHMIRAPYDRVIFLDTDTLVLGDIRGLFQLLNSHDLAARQDVYPGIDYQFPDVPEAFVEYNTGLIAFKKTPEMEAFFVDWSVEYQKLSQTSSRFDADQPSFRRTLCRSSLRHCALPGEYNFQADMGGYLFWRVKVIHCHADQEAAAQIANRFLGARAYFPKLAAVPTSFRGLRDYLATWVRLNWDFFQFFCSRVLGKFKGRRPS